MRPIIAREGVSASTMLTAVEHARAGRLRDADAVCERILALEPNNILALSLSGDLALRLNNPDVALRKLRRVVELAPQNPDYHSALGNVYQVLKRPTDAIEEFRTAWRLAPNHPSAFNRLIAVLMQEGRLEEGVAFFRASLARDPRLSASHVYLMPVLAGLGLPSEISASIETNVPIDPALVLACHALGNAVNRLSGVAPSACACRKGEILDPTCGPIYWALFNGLFNHHRYTEALACMRALAIVEPQNATAKHLIAALSGTPLERASPEYCVSLFDACAAQFDEHMTKQLRYDVPQRLAALVRELSEPPSGGWDILDLGCGTGLVGVALGPVAKSLVGVDLSPVMLEHTKARKLYTRLEKADLLDFLRREASGSYDLIVAADVFIYLGLLDDIFAEMQRLLRSHGLALFSMEALETAAIANSKSGGEYGLTISGRFAHSCEYADNLAARYGFSIEKMVEAVLRTELDEPSSGRLYALRRQ